MLSRTGNQTARIELLARAAQLQLTAMPAAAPFLADWPHLAATRPTQVGRLPVCRWLASLEPLAALATRALVRDFVAAADILEWRQTYSAVDFGPEFLERYGWTELVGLRGPIGSEKIACGFLMLGPETEYPAHAHEAEEIYLPLAGEALWMRGEESFVARAAGRDDRAFLMDAACDEDFGRIPCWRSMSGAAATWRPNQRSLGKNPVAPRR